MRTTWIFWISRSSACNFKIRNKEHFACEILAEKLIGFSAFVHTDGWSKIYTSVKDARSR